MNCDVNLPKTALSSCANGRLHANQPFGNIDKKPYPTDRSRNGGGYECDGSQPPKARSGVALESHDGLTKT